MQSSIIIPTHNRPDGLRSAVESAIEAIPKDSEIIVVDDGCDRKATDVLSDYKHDNLIIIENHQSHGPSQARNLGAKIARGETLFFLDDDDMIVHDYPSKIISLRKTLPLNCIYGFSSALQKNSDGFKPFKKSKRASGVYGKNTPLSDVLAGLGMGFWVDRSTFLQLGLLDERLRVNEDTEFCIRLAANGNICYYSSVPGVFLVGDEQREQNDLKSITKSASRLERALGFEYILTKHYSFLGDHPKVFWKFFFRIIKYRLKAGKTDGWYDFVQKMKAKKFKFPLSLISFALQLTK